MKARFDQIIQELMSTRVLRALIWGMAVLGALVSHIPALFYLGWHHGIAEQFHEAPFVIIVLVELWMAAPFLLIAMSQYLVSTIQGIRTLLVASIGIATTQLFFYFYFFNTFIVGLMVLAFPILSIPVVWQALNRATRSQNDLQPQTRE